MLGRQRKVTSSFATVLITSIEMFVNKMLESGDFVRHKYSFIKTCHSRMLQWRTQDLAVIGARCDFRVAALGSAFSGSTCRLFVPSKKQER